MAESLPFKILCPDGVVTEGAAPMVVMPGVDGDIGVMKRHSAMIVQLRRGTVAVFADSQKVGQRFYVDGGIAHITPDDLLILSDASCDLADLDDAAIQAALQEDNEEAKLRAKAQQDAQKSPVYS